MRHKESEIDVLIRARYPIIWVESFEEQRVLHLIGDIAEKQQKRTIVWSATTGLREIDGEIFKDNTEDPLSAMETIEEVDRPMIVVMKDLHRYIDDIMVYRKLRDLHQNLKTSRKTVIVISPVLTIPVELQKVITVVSLSLPGTEELNEVLNTVLVGVESSALDNPNLQEVINGIHDELSVNKDAVLNAGLGLTEDEFENVIAKSIVKNRDISLDTIIAEKEQIIKKSGILEFFTSFSDMDDVGGLESLKKWIEQRKLAFTPEAKEYGLKLPKGVFLAGPPGTGKSLVSKVIAKYMGMPLLRLDVSKIYGSYVGESEQNISLALKTAEAVAPSILMFDEVEKALSGSKGGSDSGVTARVFGTLLTWLQEHESPVFVVATSNFPLSIPPEFIRSGRFDQVFMVDLPNETERNEIFRIHIIKAGRNPDDFNCNHAAKATAGFSGAEIEGVIHDAMYNAFFEKDELNDDYIINAIKTTIPLSQKRKSEIDELRKWGTVNAISASVAEKREKKKVNIEIE